MSQAFGAVLRDGTKIQTTPNDDARTNLLVNWIDTQRELDRYQRNLEKLSEGTLDVPGFLKVIAPQMLKKLVYTLETCKDEKLRVGIAQDLLDRAGHGKIQKGAVLHQGVIDINTTKTELVNLVLGLSKKAGVKVKKESHVEGDEDFIDAEESK